MNSFAMAETDSRRVLIADDDDSTRMLLRYVLDAAGFKLAEAADGQVAIQKLDHEAFDAVVLDLMMPRVDGFGVLKHLLDTNPRMVEKVVVVTAFPKVGVNERLQDVCRIVSKPFDAGQLVTQVRNCANK